MGPARVLGRGGFLAREYRRLRASLLRPRVLLPTGTVALLAVGLLVFAQPRTSYLHDVALHTGSALIGATIIVAILTPLVARTRGRIRERGSLDYDMFTENVASATSVVKVLDTFTNLLNRPQTPAVLRAFTQALGRQVNLRILLLHPDSAAATLRAEELRFHDLRQELLRNLRVLGDFADELAEPARRHFEVRLYTASASNTLYRCDDHALISFLSLGRLSGDGTQLSINVETSLGRFVEQHFDDLWASPSTVTLPTYRYISLRIWDSHDSPVRDFVLRYVTLDGGVHVVSDPDALVISHLANVSVPGDTVTATSPDLPDGMLRLRVVDDFDEPLQAALTSAFIEKYGSPGQPYLHLEPAHPPSSQRQLEVGKPEVGQPEVGQRT